MFSQNRVSLPSKKEKEKKVSLSKSEIEWFK